MGAKDGVNIKLVVSEYGRFDFEVHTSPFSYPEQRVSSC